VGGTGNPPSRAPANANSVFTLATVLTLALAIGATVAIFAVVYRVPLNPLPYGDSGRLITIDYGAPSLNIPSGMSSITTEMYFDLVDRARTLDGVAIYETIEQTVGAEPASVAAMIVQQGGIVALGRIAVGLVAALAGGRLIESLLYGVSPRDPGIFVATTLTLLAVTLIACWLPARRAAPRTSARSRPCVRIRLGHDRPAAKTRYGPAREALSRDFPGRGRRRARLC
jgi:hypothetical protein